MPTRTVKEFRDRRLNTIDDPTDASLVSIGSTANHQHHAVARYTLFLCYVLASLVLVMNLIRVHLNEFNFMSCYLLYLLFNFCRTKVLTWQPDYKW